MTDEKKDADESTAKVFRSEADATAALQADSIEAAKMFGLTDVSNQPDGHVYCQKPDSMELVDIYPNGSWEYQDVLPNGDMRTMSGPGAAMLGYYLKSDENKKLFEDAAEQD